MNGTLVTILELLTAVSVVLGAVFVLGSALAMHRQRDALARVNVLSPATGLGMPLIVIGAFLHRWAVAGFSGVDLLKTVVTVGALLVVSSVASNVLARSTYLSGAEVAPQTSPQELANEPQQETDADQRPGRPPGTR